MSWLYSRALVEGSSEHRLSGLRQSVPLNWMIFADAFSCGGKTNDTYGPRFLFGMMFAHLTEGHGEEECMSLLEDFRVSLSAKPQGAGESL